MSFFGGIVNGITGALGSVASTFLGGGSVGSSIGSGISSLTSGLGTAYNNYQNQELSDKQNQWNRDQTLQAQGFNADQANQARSFNSAEAATSRQWSQDMQAWQNTYNSDEAQKTRDYQTQMSNTQYQRAVGDMEAAGLNPMLAYSQGGAGTPTGATASGGTPSAAQASGGMASSSAASGQRTQYNDAVASAINSGATAARMSQDLQRGQLENGQIEANTIKTYTDTLTSSASASQISAATDRIKQEITNLQKDWDLKEQQRLKNLDESAYWESNYKFDNLIKQAQFATELGKPGLIAAQAALNKANAVNAGLATPRLKNEADAQGSYWKKNISPYLPDFGSAVSSAGGAAALLGL